MTNCEACRFLYKRRGELPPCEVERGDKVGCIPELMPENRDAARVYLLVRNQFVTAGMGQPVDININAVCRVIEFFEDEIEDPAECLEKVVRVCREIIAEAREKADTGADAPPPQQRLR